MADGRHDLTLVDRVPVMAGGGRTHVGDFAMREFIDPLIADAQAVVVLASVLGGAAEADYGLSRRVNVDATLSLFEALRRPKSPPRIVFASTIAVFGVPMPKAVDDSTPPAPTMTYGAQKLMMEVALEHFTRRGWVDAIALRLPGVMAREDDAGTQKAGFMNRLFYNFRAGRDVDMPMGKDATIWLQSVRQIARNFAHAIDLPAERLGERRAFNLPALRVRIGDLVGALRARYPNSATRVSYQIDYELQAQFGNYPPLETPFASSLGFSADRDLGDLTEGAYVGSIT
jgi:nucleoside-diphosphate-sugar epimerase